MFKSRQPFKHLDNNDAAGTVIQRLAKKEVANREGFVVKGDKIANGDLRKIGHRDVHK